jgi:outer membrane protein OmpA-like peptidoglycan-associated protein
MKLKLNVLFFALLLKNLVVAQQPIALVGSNYGGVFSLQNNPTTILSDKYATYIGLGSADVHSVNNYYPFSNYSLSNTAKNGFKINAKNLLFNPNGNFLSHGFDIAGPTWIQRINPRNAFALSTRLRGMAQGTSISPNFYDLIANQDLKPGTFNQAGFNFDGQVFSEISLSYARLVWEKNVHRLKAALTAKRWNGHYAVGFTGENINGQTITTKGGLEAANFTDGTLHLQSFGQKNLDNFNVFDVKWKDLTKNTSSIGYGFDLGFSYEHRNIEEGNFVRRKKQHRYNGTYAMENTQSAYRFKISLSLTDFGQIHYQSDSIKSYSIDLKDKNISNKIDGKVRFKDILALTETPTNNFGNRFSVAMPTALRLNVDYNLATGYFLNLAALHNFSPRFQTGTRYASYVAITPRLEKKWYEVALPIALANNYQTLMVGAAARFGPLSVGTNNLLDLVNLSKNNSGSNFYVSVGMGLNRKKNDKLIGGRKELVKTAIKRKIQKIEDAEVTEYEEESEDEDGNVTSNTVSPNLDKVQDKPSKNTKNKVKSTAKTNAKGKVAAKPAPKKPLVPAPPPAVNIENFADCISFYYEKTTFNSTGFTCLGEMCKYYNAHKNMSIRITGCLLETERVPEPEKLKLNRARAVKNYLVQSGFPATKITIFADKRLYAKNSILISKNPE